MFSRDLFLFGKSVRIYAVILIPWYATLRSILADNYISLFIYFVVIPYRNYMNYRNGGALKKFKSTS